ncbi:MAG: energy-coupling factor ABC transporter permease [Oleiphilaceae bacterium]|nr:energy-coupling factor ABC transporter permease [Oleiphilaceae bacterium]
MGLTDNLLPGGQVLIASLMFLVGLWFAFRQADWERLRADQGLQHSFFGAAVVLGFLWQLRAGISPGLSVHFFGITAITLMLGWGLAVFAGLLALVMAVITGQEPWRLFAVNGLITVIIPALASHAIMLWERGRNFRNFFAYIFFCGFFGAGIAVGAAGCAMVVMLWFGGAYSWYELVHEYLRYLPLILLPEGFINGAIVTGLMVFNPERLLTLDPQRYDQR